MNRNLLAGAAAALVLAGGVAAFTFTDPPASLKGGAGVPSDMPAVGDVIKAQYAELRFVGLREGDGVSVLSFQLVALSEGAEKERLLFGNDLLLYNWRTGTWNGTEWNVTVPYTDDGRSRVGPRGVFGGLIPVFAPGDATGRPEDASFLWRHP